MDIKKIYQENVTKILNLPFSFRKDTLKSDPDQSFIMLGTNNRFVHCMIMLENITDTHLNNKIEEYYKHIHTQSYPRNSNNLLCVIDSYKEKTNWNLHKNGYNISDTPFIILMAHLLFYKLYTTDVVVPMLTTNQETSFNTINSKKQNDNINLKVDEPVKKSSNRHKIIIN